MNLREFKQHIENFPVVGTVFKNGISEPFSWRGSYDEVAFSIILEEMTREEVLNRIHKALTEVVDGCGGGDFYYHNGTPVNFEEAPRVYSDGGYRDKIIYILENCGIIESHEMKLVKLAFFKHLDTL